MRIPFLTSKKAANVDQKTVDIRDVDLGDLSEASVFGLTDGSPLHILPHKAYRLAERNLDLGKAINDISSTIAALKIGLTYQADEIDYSAAFVARLNAPGEGQSAAQFWRNGVESFLLTNEFWIVARGPVEREPLGLLFMRPYDVTVEISCNDGLPLWIRTESDKNRRTYYREERAGRIRYIDKLRMNEICPIIGATSLVDDWRGRSPLAKLYYDLKMSTDGKRHNTSLLKNGMRTTGVFSPTGAKPNGEMWPVKAIQGLADRLRSFNQGAGNAGNVVVSSVPVKLDGLSQSNRDMDFLNLLQVSRESIYNLYSYPLPLVLSDTMTLDNYTVAQQAFYTEAVFPVFEEIASGIVYVLGPRFNLPENAELTFSESTIKALQPVRFRAMETLKNTEAATINEARRVGGFEDDPAGDVIMVTASKVPLSIAASGFDSIDMPDEGGDDDAA